MRQIQTFFRNHFLPPFWSFTSLWFFFFLILQPGSILLLGYSNKMTFHFQFLAWKQKCWFSTREAAARVLLEELQGLFPSFLPAFCLGGEGGIFKGELRKCTCWNPLRYLHPATRLIHTMAAKTSHSPQGREAGHPKLKSVYTREFLCETDLAFLFCFYWPYTILNFPDFSTPMLQK